MKTRLSPTHIVLLGFMFLIFVGSLLLYLPISSANGEQVKYIDALFTATTATCVTGLVTVPTFSTWSTFGHIVILILIQIGGMGVITVAAGLMLLLKQKIGISNRVIIQNSFNLNSLSGIISFIKKVIAGTFIIEALGALLYMTVFVPEYGLKGIFISVFNSVSAFCNAGLDIIKPNSLCDYSTNFIINITTSLLIIFGGIGFVVWWDILRVIKSKFSGKFAFLTLHSKIALGVTAVLVIGGGVLVLVFEYNNPDTIGNMTLFQKLQAAMFQSVTTRTAGFMTVPQENLTNASSLLSLLLMFIGGSPVGTAGGIKTVTFFVLLATAYSVITNKNTVNCFNRQISPESVKKAIAVFVASAATAFVSSMLLYFVTDAAFLDVLYETVSATATVGLSRNFTSTLGTVGKIIIIATMYFGRVGPISIAVAFNTSKRSKNTIENPIEEISVG